MRTELVQSFVLNIEFVENTNKQKTREPRNRIQAAERKTKTLTKPHNRWSRDRQSGNSNMVQEQVPKLRSQNRIRETDPPIIDA